MTVSDAIAQTEGLPRANGELVFAEPWEARAFGVAVALCGERGLDWEEFRGRLIAEIDGWERANGVESDGWSYYERWLAALERLVVERGLVGSEEIERRAAAIAHHDAHDHDHDHDHDHH
ncbi:MAG: nitrile hydratase accessory protein [Actinobacteria bacterium]|nr:nitrile hydratase accessory protein [Actinomycetota bacterium]